MPTDSSIAASFERVRERVARAAARVGRDASGITIVAVSKTFSANAIRSAYDAGLRHFGENRVQEFEAKRANLTGLNPTWHFIGHLQSNKARRAVQLFDRIDTVDSPLLAQKLDAAAAAERKRLRVLVEVHLGAEESKSGILETELAGLAEHIATLPNLEMHGLMTIPPYFDASTQASPYFRKLRELRDELSRRFGRPMPTLSMGMSHDFEIAIEEGATEIRLGTALFGERG
jgi:pyridoxal phosphate enzyme (YggS family)